VNQNKEPGQIFTFYSYKGGTGRSMALANVACLLARHKSDSIQGRVLLVDWDLEAPGLHRFFQDRLRDLTSQALELRPGLIDIFSELRKALSNLPKHKEEPTSNVNVFLRQTIPLGDYVIETEIDNLHLLTAGRFDDGYARRVNSFNWNALNNLAPWLFTWFGNYLAEAYDYVLIDSRTGITDASGICTSILPERLITVFTPNRQSLEGVLEIAKRAVSYRRKSDDLRPLLIFPLPSRIEPTMERLRRFWRSDQAIGYQPRFEDLIRQTYGVSKCSLADYFDDVQIQQVPDYAYGEGIAVLDQNSVGDRLSLARSYEAFVVRLTSNAAPWEPASEDYGSVFVSYESLDREFATRLIADLEGRGIRTWFPPHELHVGEPWKNAITEAIRSSDKVLLILSKNSIQSRSVRQEVETAFGKEREGARVVLVPIQIDNTVLTADVDWIRDVRRVRHIGDFTNWNDPIKYSNALARLLKDLSAESK
jgi:MinD-like ATPase involved in chromosome partitioning or flagellar assembly